MPYCFPTITLKAIDLTMDKSNLAAVVYFLSFSSYIRKSITVTKSLVVVQKFYKVCAFVGGKLGLWEIISTSLSWNLWGAMGSEHNPKLAG